MLAVINTGRRAPLFRALDWMDLSPAETAQRLIRQLFELDADYTVES